jgi:hypothetical protein
MDFTQTTNRIDYGVKSLIATDQENKSTVTLERIGLMPMPIDVTMEFTDGSIERYYIPLRMMRGEKPVSNEVRVLDDWTWANPNYEFTINRPKKEIKTVIIDPKNKMADVNKYNNSL